MVCNSITPPVLRLDQRMNPSPPLCYQYVMDPELPQQYLPPTTPSQHCREINHAKEENNVDEEFEPSSTTNSDYKQKQFALRSTEFNLKSKFFNEL